MAFTIGLKFRQRQNIMKIRTIPCYIWLYRDTIFDNILVIDVISFQQWRKTGFLSVSSVSQRVSSLSWYDVRI